MIFTVNIANSHITLGCVEKEEVLFLERIFADTRKTELEYSVNIMNAFRIHRIDRSLVSGSIISCVVPVLQPVFTAAVERLFSITPVIVSAGMQKILTFKTDRPSEIGPNLIVQAAASSTFYGCPTIVADLSTATTISAVDENHMFIGASILPGIQTSIMALLGQAAQLSAFHFEESAITAIGRTTEQSLAGGAVYGHAGMIDGILDRMEKELGKTPVFVATGRLAKILIPYCRHDIIVDENLTVRGLALLYTERRLG